MTAMQIDRATIAQALEALEYAQQGRECPSTTRQAITALRATLARQKDPTDPGRDVDVLREHVRHLERRVRQLHAQQAEPVGKTCTYKCEAWPECGCAPPKAEPVEPVAWMFESERNFNLVGYGGWEKRITECRPNTPEGSVRNVTPLYTAPSQRKPLTEKEMYIVEEEARKNFRLAQAGPRGQMITYWDSLTPWLIRAVERAHGIKE